ncbi:MAG: glycosyltransferase family 2 protein [Burkholderiaceae bacterium]|jgi:N-acetylglucosaminyl-diphospho-decaprenol L-rhamnosyltransferase|nr:MAG: glycosyltransferase family 2 protein [Burkholderiaceae bacterium]
MDLSILIVTYNSRRLIDPLLTHLQQELAHLDAEVVLVDNASYDGTAQQVRAAHPWVRVIDSTTNLGFAAGKNLAARHARGRHLLLLNPDALPAPGALRRGITLMDQHPQAGLGGGELRGTDGSRQPSARMFPTLRDEFFTLAGLAARHPTSRLFGRLDRRWADPEQAALVDWIPGAFVFIPAAVWARLGGFDERFFMYYEEVDLCRRLQAAGLQVHYWPELKATHIGGASARTVAQAQVSKSGSQLERWRMRSALLYYRKQHGPAAAALLHALERGWHRLRQLKARLQGRAGCAAEFDAHCRQLVQAWHDTAGGQRCPARPW